MPLIKCPLRVCSDILPASRKQLFDLSHVIYSTFPFRIQLSRKQMLFSQDSRAEAFWNFRGSFAEASPSLPFHHFCVLSQLSKKQKSRHAEGFFNTAYVNHSTITFFMHLARKLFQDFVQLPRKLPADLA